MKLPQDFREFLELFNAKHAIDSFDETIIPDYPFGAIHASLITDP